MLKYICVGYWNLIIADECFEKFTNVYISAKFKVGIKF